jgi:hypothetical protein
MQHEELLRRLFAKSKLLEIFATNGKLWENLAFYTACAINIIILASYGSNDVLIKKEINGDP